jgi:hypothetical protein
MSQASHLLRKPVLNFMGKKGGLHDEKSLTLSGIDGVSGYTGNGR